MSGRRSQAVAKAVRLVRKGMSRAVAAKRCGCHVSSIRRAMAKDGDPVLPVGRPRVNVGNEGRR